MGPAIPVLGAPLGPAFISFYIYLSRVLGLKSGCHQTNFDFIWIINSSELSFCICEVDSMAPASSSLKQRRERFCTKPPVNAQHKTGRFLMLLQLSQVPTPRLWIRMLFSAHGPWVGFQNQSLVGSVEPLVVCYVLCFPTSGCSHLFSTPPGWLLFCV